MASKKLKSDTVSAALVMMSSEVPSPPAHVHLRNEDFPFWDSIVRARAYDSWTNTDLEQAANLARCKSDIERIQKEIDAEGDVIENQRGTKVVNPKHTLLETLSRRAVALSRMLQVHSEATVGESRHQAKRSEKQRDAEKVLKQTEGDNLLARPSVQ